MSEDPRPVTSEDWREFLAFLARRKSVTTQPREGETVEGMKERIRRFFALLKIEVEITEEHGTWRVWNTTDRSCHGRFCKEE